jgi:hypothetical protein
MNPGISVLERAFLLAATGRYDTVTQIKRQLETEGYASLQVSGPALFKQLRTEISYAHRSAATSRHAAAEWSPFSGKSSRCRPPNGTDERPGTGTRAGSFSRPPRWRRCC